MRVALHSVIRPGSVADYRGHHQRIPDDLAALFARARIHNWTIWRSGDRLFHLVECDDFDRAMSVVAPDPANQRWQEEIGRFVDHFRDAEGNPQMAPLEQVWELVRQ